MAIPTFLAELRALVGTRPLWLSGVAAVITDDRGRVLLNRRSDNGRWALIGGILDPGEQPAEGLAREVLEETGVSVEPERLTSVTVSPLLEYPNGDRAQYLDLTFRCRLLAGEPRVNDDESLEVGWFAPDALPPLDGYARHRLDLALAGAEHTVFSFEPDVSGS
ncbi:NUDIX domain-containing protein [Kitasatospora sp. NPDC085879]|jgi:8-oxo-dGTP pyrophosphatase MutT (NUDIX family)|uniref:NUDIX hydrolase n=1 Tax=Kitasatospora sp. NPDC085879 TaxID=3154769 RepID=UPI000BB1009B|nr:NUDIX domain-containing protein [Streptomyces sp. TLI_235]PBC71359.1 ADP-ribose pyrophosphatase YjhB (NUDIX family) [Streptomyces sp. TLI_235]